MAKGIHPPPPYDKNWYKAGTGKNGQPVIQRSRPRTRLTISQAMVLQLFFKDNQPKSMREVLVEFFANYPAWAADNEFDAAKASRDLKELRQDGFLTAKMALPQMVDRHERSYAYRKKATFSLSQKARKGKLALDSNRWVKVNGVYVASKKTKSRVEAKENSRANQPAWR